MSESNNAAAAETIGVLIESLSGDDPVARQEARERLVEIDGPQVTRALVGSLVDPRRQVRWEAAKALAVIADPVAAPGLMHALDDDDEDVRWVAGEGLVVLEQIGLMTVLSGLTKRARSLDYCKSAHHVLHELKRYGFGETVAPVLEALETSEPGVAAPVAAYNAMMALTDRGD